MCNVPSTFEHCFRFHLKVIESRVREREIQREREREWRVCIVKSQRKKAMKGKRFKEISDIQHHVITLLEVMKLLPQRHYRLTTCIASKRKYSEGESNQWLLGITTDE